MNQYFEGLLKSYYIQEGHDILAYNVLSEEQKQLFTRDIVTTIVKSIEDREYELDNELISKSKGDITKLDNYNYIVSSLNILNTTQLSVEEKIPYLDILNDAHKNLKEFSDDFERGYKLQKDIIKIFYSQVVLGLIQSISFLISTSLDYVKDPTGNYQTSIRYNVEKLNKYPTVNIECLQKFNTMAVNGELRHFFIRIYTDKTLSEDTLFSAGMQYALGSLSVVGRTLFSITKLIPSVPDILRMFVSMSYSSRIKTSDYMRLQAYYIDLNVEKQRNFVKPNTKSIKKQEKIMKNLLKLADKIDIDQKTASKNARIEIEEQNKNISKSIKNSPQNVDSGNTPEEIIL